MGAMAKIKTETSFLNKRSGTQFHHDWKPMQSIICILHKNFQEDHTNSRRFPGVVDTLKIKFTTFETIPWSNSILRSLVT